MKKCKLFCLTLIITILLAVGLAGKGWSAFPEKPVNLIVCFGAGGSTDTVIRAMNDQLSDKLDVPAVVMNKPGSGGQLGARFASKAAPDGYTVLVLSLSHLLRMAIDPDGAVDIMKNFDLVGRYVNQPLILGVGKDSQFNSLQEMIAYAKQNPGNLKYGSAGIGATGHFAAEQFIKAAGLDIKHVPFKGDANATTATMGGHVHFSVTGLPKFGPKAASGDIKLLAAYTTERISDLPDVPTFTELGFPAVVMYSWFGFAVPKGTPKDIITKLANALEQAIKDPVTMKNLNNLKFNEWFIGPDQMDEFARNEYMTFKKVADTAGIKVGN
jgi:tripartite-type tricarboxylate transporter receptor subunit TctC